MRRFWILGWVAAWAAGLFAAFAADEEFVGTTAVDPETCAFVGGLDTNVPIHCITWRLTFLKNTAKEGTYRLVARYGLQGKNDPNQLEVGPTVKLNGRWALLKGSKANPQAAVYRLKSNSNGRILSLAQVGNNLLHFLDHDRNLKVGNAGWSFTLNRKDHENATK